MDQTVRDPEVCDPEVCDPEACDPEASDASGLRPAAGVDVTPADQADTALPAAATAAAQASSPLVSEAAAAVRRAADQLVAALAGDAGSAGDPTGTFDDRSGLYRQASFLKQLKAEFDRARRYGRRFSLALMAPDGDAGSPAAIGAVLTDVLRACDVVARLDDGRFALLLPETLAPGARCAVERVREALLELDDAGLAGTPPGPVTACYGLATFTPGDVAPRNLMQRAEWALRRARRDGPDEICAADAEAPADSAGVADLPTGWGRRGATPPIAGGRQQAGTAGPPEFAGLTASFLADVARELLAPVCSVVGAAEMLHDRLAGPLDGVYGELADRLELDAARIRGRLEAMLAVACLDASATPPAEAPVDLLAACEEVVAALTPMARAAGVLLAVTRDGGASIASGDGRRLRHALALLLERTIARTPAGERIEVRVFRTEDQVRVEIATSVAVHAEAVLERLLGSPSGLSPAVLRLDDGAGFRVVAARRIVEAHGGALGHECGLGRGSALWLVLPTAATAHARPSAITIVPDMVGPV